jgi:hypothetical protein
MLDYEDLTEWLKHMFVVQILETKNGPGSIPGTTRKKTSGSGTGSTQPREYNWGATW